MNDYKRKKLKEFYEELENSITNDDFEAFKKQVMEGIVKGQTLLTKKIEEKQSTKDAEADEVIREIREQGKALLEEMRGEGQLTFSGMKTRALEAMNALFNKMRLQEKFDVLVSQFVEKLADLDERIQQVPTVEEVASRVVVPQRTITPSDIPGLEEFIKKLIPEQRLGGGGGTSAIGVQYAMGRIVKNETPTGAIDGVNLSYTVSEAIHAVFAFSINGQFIADDLYTINGRTILFTTALDATLAGTKFRIAYV